ncbi:hypothetical protein, partial [Pseudomonas aeruginosa]|uniref:hypothetical protein n=1 Tax=Pseudomonas aeruginosa TaxID=287 RepID=UPI002358559B
SSMWVQIAILVASYLISSATSAKAPKPKPEALTSEDLPQTEDGTGHYVIFGDVWIEDWIVLGTGHERMQAVKSKGSKK